MFFFFSNRIGCMGSLLLSLAVTAVLFLVFFRPRGGTPPLASTPSTVPSAPA